MRNSKMNYSLLRFIAIIFFALSLTWMSLSLINSTGMRLRGDYPLRGSTKEQIIKNSFLQDADSIDTIILGDSHAGQSFNQLIHPGWFKATHPGEDMELSLIKLKYFLQHGENIKRVVVPLDYHTLNGSWGVPKEEYRIYQEDMINKFISKLIQVNPLLDDYNRKLVVRWITARLTAKIWPATDISAAQVSTTGFETINPGSSDLLEKVRNRANGMLHQPIIATQTDTVMKDLFLLAKEYNLQLIGVRFPLPNDFLNYIYKNDLNKVDYWIEGNQDKFFEIYDYRYLFAENQEMFGNEDHVNIPGSNAFTSRFFTDYYLGRNNILNDGMLNKYPLTEPVISLPIEGVGLLALESPYGVETDGKSSWIWLGSGIAYQLKAHIYAKEPITGKFELNGKREDRFDIEVRLNGKPTSNLISLKQGLNTLEVQVIGEESNSDSDSPEGDLRKLDYKLNSLVIR